MKTITSLILLLWGLFSLNSVAQVQFEWQNRMPPGNNNYQAFFDEKIFDVTDFNNDGFIDVLTQSHIYLNDGQGNFTTTIPLDIQNTPQQIIAVDWDMDGYKDLIVNYGSDLAYLEFYVNDGTNQFALNSLFYSLQVKPNLIKIADVDGDGDPDMYITGYDQHSNNNNQIGKILINDGAGYYTATDVNNATTAFFMDLDNDGDLDLFLYRNTTGSYFYYNNNGSGQFILEPASPINGFGANLNIVDINSDGFPDLITSNPYNTNKLYLNDTNGQFLFLSDFPAGITAGIDIDQDNDMDLFVGLKLFLNDGSGGFYPYIDMAFDDYPASNILFGDFNHDQVIDAVVDNILYINLNLHFYPISKNYFAPVKNSCITTADIDNDGDQDVLVSGETKTGQLLSILYSNDGNEIFSIKQSFPGLKFSHIEFADIDNDGDADFLLAGKNMQDLDESHLYKNDGTGDFSETSYPNTGSGFHFVDFDNDGDIDIMYGTNMSENDGNGHFSTAIDPQISPTYAYGDIDGDGGIDIIYVKEYASNDYMTFIERSNGNSGYTLDLIGGEDSQVYLHDLDHDGDLDYIVNCLPNPGNWLSRYEIHIYENDGTGQFTERMQYIGLLDGNIAFADVDGDNDDDVLISGLFDLRVRPSDVSDVSFEYATLLLNTDFQYNECPDITIPNLTTGNMIFTDINNDQKQDLLITGNGGYQGFNDWNDTNTLYFKNDSSNDIQEYNPTKKTSIVYPNPNHGSFAFKNIIVNQADIQILNSSGQVLYEFSKADINHNFLELKLQKGIYFIIVEYNNQKMIDKFIVD